MSDNIKTKQDAEVKEEFDGLDMASLRMVAKALNIQAERTWTKVDLVKAIQNHQNTAGGSVNFMPDGKEAPKPGYARILVHRNPTPGHKNTPIHVGFNGTLFQIPRGIEVDLPKEFISSLKDAVARESREVENGVFEEVDQLSYPYQVIAITPGEWKNPNDSRAVAFKIRRDFYDEHGVWPTAAELREYKTARTKSRNAK